MVYSVNHELHTSLNALLANRAETAANYIQRFHCCVHLFCIFNLHKAFISTEMIYLADECELIISCDQTSNRPNSLVFDLIST